MLRKNYLVQDEKYPAVPKHSPPTPEAPTQSISSSSSTSAKEEAEKEEEKDKETEAETPEKAPLEKMG